MNYSNSQNINSSNFSRPNSQDQSLKFPPPQSKRQRFLGLVKATKETYIPNLAGSISQFATDASNRAFGDPNVYNADGTLKLPLDTKIILYPLYTRIDEDTSEYVTEVLGWLYCPGTMNRKNRLMFTLARQIVKSSGNFNQESTNQAIDQLQDEKLTSRPYQPSDDQGSISSGSSTYDLTLSQNGSFRPPSVSSSLSSIGNLNKEETMRERLSMFIARSIPDVPIDVVVGSEDSSLADEIKRFKIITDANGRFETKIRTPYEPSIIHASVSYDETVFNVQNILQVKNTGVGIISDIDDTIKLTGVIGDKRELLRSLLTKDVSEWAIAGVSAWYRSLYELGVQFHYVSNSPWQLYSTIQKFFQVVNFPAGSVNLKQYSGNLLASIMEPSRDKKRNVLEKILKDFPKRKFICIGDSGEQDLEAYVDLARKFPEQIKGIYIRVVPDSLSDIDDRRVLADLRDILSENQSKRKSQITRQPKPSPSPPTTKSSEPLTDAAIEDLIDLSDAPPKSVKLAPMIPKKPTALKGNQLKRKPPLEIMPESELKLQLPPRPYTLSEPTSGAVSIVSNVSTESPPPPPPPRRRTKTYAEGEPIIMHSSQDDNGIMYNQVHNTEVNYYYDDFDRKGEAWVRRIKDSLDSLNADLELKFWCYSEDMLKDSHKLASELLAKCKSNEKNK